MLPKLSRLNLKKDFEFVTSGKKLETKYLKLFLKTGGNKIPLIGIASPSKVFRKATQRNRARRLTSAAFEAIYLKLPESLNIIALPKEGILGVKSQEVLSDLEKALINEKIIN